MHSRQQSSKDKDGAYLYLKKVNIKPMKQTIMMLWAFISPLQNGFGPHHYGSETLIVIHHVKAPSHPTFHLFLLP